MSEMLEILCFNLVDDFGISEIFPLFKKFENFQRQKKNISEFFFFFFFFFFCLFDDEVCFSGIIFMSSRCLTSGISFTTNEKKKLKKNQLLVFSRARKPPIFDDFWHLNPEIVCECAQNVSFSKI